MRLVVTNTIPCRLQRGEMRRVPQDRRAWLIGYHVCCPRCGFLTLVQDGVEGQEIDESLSGDVTFGKPARCVLCNVLIQVEECEATLLEDEHVRRLPR